MLGQTVAHAKATVREGEVEMKDVEWASIADGASESESDEEDNSLDDFFDSEYDKEGAEADGADGVGPGPVSPV